MRNSSLPSLKHLLPAVAAFVLIATLSTTAFGTVTPIWYSNAVAVVALLTHPMRSWAWFLVPMGIGDAAVIHFLGHGPGLPLALVDMLEILLVVALIRATGGIRVPVFEGWQIARVIVACLLVPAVSAALAAFTLSLTDGAMFASTWRAWYSASALGLVIVCPFLLSWIAPQVRALALGELGARAALVLAGGALLAAALVQTSEHAALLFLTYPIAFALAWAYGLAGATLCMAAVTVAVLWATMQGRGGIAQMLPGAPLTEQIEAAQVYLASMFLCSLPLTVVRSQQDQLTHNLRRAGEARTEFLAAMSHEIRTPMTGVLGMVDLLASEPLTPRQQRYVDALRSSGRHLMSVINDILDFTRIESGRLELDEADFRLREVLEQVQSLANPLAVERGLALAVEAPPDAALVLRGDAFRLRQVLLNLVTNAIKFTERGSVHVAVAQHPAEDPRTVRVVFQVRDTGVGIEPEKIAQLFTAFTQADRSISRQYGGTGLGLAISKRLVEAMGGTIGVASVPLQGSVFSVEVPLRRGDPGRVTAAVHGEHAAVRPLRILVAEDVEINREIVRTVLERDGHQLAFARDGAEALALQQRGHFDLVLMDVQMPVMDGVEATRRIRQLPPPKGLVPIVGLTANVMARERERYLAAGMDDCLAKPIDWDVLQAVIARLAGAAEPAGKEPAPKEPRAVLVDEHALAALRRMARDEQLAELMATGLRGYEEACEQMESDGAGAEVFARQAHKVRGSAGTLGLAAVSALAERIELAAIDGVADAGLLAQLRGAVEATRAELRRRGLLPPGYEAAKEPAEQLATAASSGAGRPSR